MIENYFLHKSDRAKIKKNYLASFIEDEAIRFHNEGHASDPARQKLRGMACFGDWLRKNKISISTISRVHAEKFLSSIKNNRNIPCVTFRRQKSSVSRVIKAVQKIFPPAKTAIELEIDEFINHIRINRGLAETNFRNYQKYVKDFLTCFFCNTDILIDSLRPVQVRDYICKLAKTVSLSNLRMARLSLKLYFAFLEYRGLSVKNHIAAFPTITNQRRSLSPDVLAEIDFNRLLKAVDRSTPSGKRTYASILCMSDLGVRVSDVANMLLDDVDWTNGTICIGNQKTRSPFYLPLPKRAGEALVDYIMNGRPKTDDRHIFLNCQIYRETLPASVTALQIQVRRLWVKAGLYEKYSGTHIFRHSKATQLRCMGIPLKVIADLLGHKTIETTKLYAQVDIPALREVAQHWPE